MGETAPHIAPRLTRTVVLIGMMGAGKTAVGRALASRLGVAIRDSDAEIESRSGLSIEEIFNRYGEGFFREKEAQVIARLVEGDPAILSTGGGAWLDPGTRATLTGAAAVLWLKADIDLLWQRVKHKYTRPLLRSEDPRATLEAIHDARVPVYALAPHVVEVDPGWSIEDTTDAVLAVLQDVGAVEPAG